LLPSRLKVGCVAVFSERKVQINPMAVLNPIFSGSHGGGFFVCRMRFRGRNTGHDDAASTASLRANLPASTLYEMGKRVLNAPFDGDAPTDNGLQTLKDWVGLKVMAQEVTIG